MLALEFHIFVMLKHSDSIYCNNTIGSFLISCYSDSQMTFCLPSRKKNSFFLLLYTCCPAIKMLGFHRGGTSISIKMQQAIQLTNGKLLNMSAAVCFLCDSNYTLSFIDGKILQKKYKVYTRKILILLDSTCTHLKGERFVCRGIMRLGTDCIESMLMDLFILSCVTGCINHLLVIKPLP